MDRLDEQRGLPLSRRAESQDLCFPRDTSHPLIGSSLLTVSNPISMAGPANAPRQLLPASVLHFRNHRKSLKLYL